VIDEVSATPDPTMDTVTFDELNSTSPGAADSVDETYFSRSGLVTKSNALLLDCKA
jgi:hypothetical protein